MLAQKFFNPNVIQPMTFPSKRSSFESDASAFDDTCRRFVLHQDVYALR